MPNLKDMKKTIKSSDIPKSTINKINFPTPTLGSFADDVMTLVEQMDRVLTKEQKMAVMEQQGCCKTSAGKEHIAFGEEHKDKTLEEKLKLLEESNLKHKGSYKLNEDGTLTITMKMSKNDEYICVCRVVRIFEKSKSKPTKVPLTFCGCCAGHLRHTHGLSLGIDLQLKDVISSPANSLGKKWCEFVFNIV